MQDKSCRFFDIFVRENEFYNSIVFELNISYDKEI